MTQIMMKIVPFGSPESQTSFRAYVTHSSIRSEQFWARADDDDVAGDDADNQPNNGVGRGCGAAVLCHLLVAISRASLNNAEKKSSKRRNLLNIVSDVG